MANLPKISIITPSYNQGGYIEETILSIIGQGYPNLEYIIIDGGSKDQTVEVIKKYEDRISYWVSEKDKGQSDAINKGLKLATGDIVAWLNSDDIYIDGCLMAVGNAFARNPSAQIVFGDVVNFDENGKRTKHRNHFELFDFMSRVSIHQPGVFWKRELNEQFGYLDESFYYLMDYELWMRIFLNAELLRIEQDICLFRVHNDAKTSNNPQGLYDDYRRVISRFANSLANASMKQRIQELGLYFNKEEVRYTINRQFSTTQLETIANTYIYNCIVQEYTRGHIAATNKLLLKTFGKGNFAAKLQVLLKNNTLGFLRKIG